jgi:gamma-glutamyltranspeptidase
VISDVPDLSEEVGHAQAIWVQPDGSLAEGSDPRADGAPA